MSNIVVIQRVLANYREGFFDLLSKKIHYDLICSDKNAGKIIAPDKINNKKYIYNPVSIKISTQFIFFPFLFFTLISMQPKHIITEGGQNTINNLFVWLYCKIFNCDYTIWDLGKGHIKTSKNKSFIRKIYDKLYNFILKDAKQVYTYNNRGIRYFRSEGFNKNIIPLKNTIDTREVEYAISNYDKNKQQCINEKFNKFKYYLLYVGVLNEKKRLEDLKIIMDMLPDEYGLIIIGSGNEQYVNKLKRLLDNGRTYFEGYKNMDQLQYYYNKVDCLILPGLGGLSINQAMAFGTPVICTEADGIEEELVIDGETGYIYDTIDKAVKYIVGNSKEKWARMGENAKNLFFKNYTIEKMVERFIENL